MQHPFAQSRIDFMLEAEIYGGPLAMKQQGHLEDTAVATAIVETERVRPHASPSTTQGLGAGHSPPRVLGICCLAWPGDFRSPGLGLVPKETMPPKHPLSLVPVFVLPFHVALWVAFPNALGNGYK